MGSLNVADASWSSLERLPSSIGRLFLREVTQGQVIATTGYFINPLVSVFLGLSSSKKRSVSHSGSRWSSVFGVSIQVIDQELPIISLTLAFGFGFCGSD